MKRLSSFFDSDNEDTFPAAPSSSTTAADSQIDVSATKNGASATDDIDPEFKEHKVEEMVKLTLVSKDMCVFYLESMNWNVAAAVKSYYDCLR